MLFRDSCWGEKCQKTLIFRLTSPSKYEITRGRHKQYKEKEKKFY